MATFLSSSSERHFKSPCFFVFSLEDVLFRLSIYLSRYQTQITEIADADVVLVPDMGNYPTQKLSLEVSIDYRIVCRIASMERVCLQSSNSRIMTNDVI